MNTSEKIQLARKQINAPCSMHSSALLCLSEAIEQYDDGDFETAGKWALKSLRYSVGVFHADYQRVSMG